jgi:hypothetical protein
VKITASPTLALAHSLGLAVIHPSPACDHFDHWARPATNWVNVSSSPRPTWLRACLYCAANARTEGRDLLEITDTPPQGIQDRLPL